MAVLIWILGILYPLIFYGAVVYFAFMEIEPWVVIVGVGAALLGLIIGFFGWKEIVSPRWRWVKGNVDLLGSRVSTALGHALYFFFIPAGVKGLIYTIELIIEKL